MHIFPDLKRLEAKFGDTLVVIGVHSAKFDNEKVTQALRQAVVRYGLDHPVVNDAGFKIWNAYTVHAWPTLYLVDPEGRIAGWVSGEGNYEVIERKIAALVEAFGAKGKLDRTPPRWALERDRLQAGNLSYPGKVAAAASPARLVIADSHHHRIVVADPSGKVLDVAGGTDPGFVDGDFAKARFHGPQGVCAAGDVVYVADTENHAIRRIDLGKRTVETVAGTGKQEWSRRGGAARDIGLNSPWDVALDGNDLYIAMAGDHRIWTLDLAASVARPFAGSGREDIRDGARGSSAFAQPSGLWIADGSLYVADSESSGVRTIGLGPDGEVRTLIGTQGDLFDFGDIDGAAADARLQHPLAVLVHDGKVFVADTYNHKIKTIDPKTRAATTLLGTGKPGAADGGASATRGVWEGPSGPDSGGSRAEARSHAAEFNEPSGLARIGDTLYIADTNNHAIRACDLKTREVRTVTLTFPK